MTFKREMLYLLERRPAFLLGLLISFVVIFGPAYIIAYRAYTKAIDATILSNRTRATLLAKLVLEHQRAAIGVLQAYAGRPLLVDAIKTRDFEGALRHLRDLRRANPEMDWPFISNPDSTVWVNYPVDRQVWNKDLSFRDWYKGVNREWKPYVSNVYKLMVGEKDLAVAICVPVFDEQGRVIGILSTAQSTVFLQKTIGEDGFNLDVNVILIDQEGHIIYSNEFPYTKEVTGYPRFGFIEKAMRGEKGDIEVRDRSNQDRIKYVSFAPIEEIGWAILVERPRSEVLRSEASYLALIGVTALLIYGFAALSLVGLRKRRRQVKELEELNEKLDERVRERTAELEAGNNALRASEERYRSLFEGMTEGFALHEIICDGKGAPCDYCFLEINPAFERLTGLRRMDVLGKTLRQVLPGEDPKWVKLYGEVALTGRSIHFENYSSVLKKHYEVFAYCPSPRQFGVLFMDITERKSAEEQILKSENELRLVMDTVPALMSYIDAGFHYRRVNQGYQRWFGLAPQELEGRHVREALGEDAWEIARPWLERTIAGETLSYEEQMPYRTGGSRWVNANLVPDYDPAGKVRGLVALVTDITERKQAEQALRYSEERLREANELLEAVTKGTNVIIAALDLDLRYTFFNTAYAAEIKRLTGKDIRIGASMAELFSDQLDQLAVAEREWREVLAGNTTNRRLEFGDPGHHRRVYSVLHTPLRDTDGRVVGAGEVAYDITEQVQAEEMLKRRTLELQQLTETLEARVKERTAELADVSSRLVSAQENERKRISYDLHDNVWQTLLAIRSEIEHLLSNRNTADRADLQDKAKKVTGAILDLVSKIRSMQGDLWPYVLDDIGIVATIDWYCREFEKNHSGLTIESHAEFGEDEIPSPAKIVIYRILQETLNNVAKYSQASHVTLRLSKNARGLEFTIEDNGIGFDPEDAIAKRTPWGGLGLLSIKARTELSGGSFAVESTKGKGTTVRAAWNF